MDALTFRAYLRKFECEIIAPGVSSGMFGKDRMVSVRNGKLSRRSFGRLLGGRVESEAPFAVDYYGHIKKSAGLMEEIARTTRDTKGQVRMIETGVVYFASIKIEQVALLNVHMVVQFPDFKQTMLKKRGFKK